MSQGLGLCDKTLRRRLRTIAVLAVLSILPYAWDGSRITIELASVPWLQAPVVSVLLAVLFEGSFCLLIAGPGLVVWVFGVGGNLLEQVMKLRLARASLFLSAVVSPIPWTVVLFFVPYVVRRLSGLADALLESDPDKAVRAAADVGQSFSFVVGWLGLVLALSKIHRLIDHLEGRRP